MKHAAYYLRCIGSAWSIYDLTDREQGSAIEPLIADLDQQAIAKYLAERCNQPAHADTARLVIGLPASWCLCATVSEEGLPKTSTAQHREALNYRLEAQLPITAESCAIDYTGNGPERLGVAVEAGRLLSLVHDLEDLGHTIEAIVPSALLAAQNWLDAANPNESNESVSLVWLEKGGSIDPGLTQVVHISSDSPPRWRIIDNQTDGQQALRQQLEIDEAIASTSNRCWHTTPEAASCLVGALDETLELEELTDALEAEITQARMFLSNQQPWVNLTCGPLAARHHWRRLKVPTAVFIAALMMLLLSVLSVLWLRADAYDRIAEEYDNQSAEVFSQAMPGQAVPTSPTRRLQARLQQLRGETGLAGIGQMQATSGDSESSGGGGTLLLLHDLLDALPSDQRYAITDLRIEDGQFRMTGYARTHSEADQIAKTLRGSALFTVEPPSTDNLKEGGVRFALQATHTTTPPPELPEEREDKLKPGPSGPTAEPPSLAKRAKQGGVR